MAFLVPAVLLGAAAIAAPIAIHFLNKTRVRVIRWAATRFLMESLQRNQRRLQVEDLILLLLRCLFIILLALAFARLVLNPGGSQDLAGSGPVAVVLLLDQSASMGQSDGFRTRFDQAKEAASKMVGGMAGGSQAALFLVGQRVNQVIPRPTGNLPFVRRALDVAALTDQAGDLGTAIQTALETLRPFTGAGKEIAVFTDAQASSMPDPAELKKWLAGSPDVKVRFVDLGAKAGEDNLAITGFKAETGVPAAGQLTGFLVEISNFGQTAAQGLRVTLSVDDGPPVDETVLADLAAGRSQVVRLNARFAKPGYYTLRAAIPSDRLPVDNERAIAIHVVDHVSVVVVEGGKAKQSERRDGFFLANALTPVSPARRPGYYLQVDPMPPDALATADLSRRAAIFLVNLPKLDAAAAKNLENYVKNGGALVVFPGPLVTPAAYNDDLVFGPMLPAKLGPLSDAAHGGKPLAWQAGNYTHPVTALWNEAKIGSLAAVRAATYFPLTLNGPAPRVIVKYANDTPAAAEGSYGKGRVVLFSSSATTDWTNLPIHPNFVPFLQRLIAYLAPDAAAESLAVAPGVAFQTKVAGDLVSREFSVIAPGAHGKARPAGKVELVNQDAVVRYRSTEKTGPYRLVVAGNESPVAAFAVQMDPRESDLKMLSDDQLAALPGGSEAAAPAGPASAAGGKVRRELWLVFLLAAFAVAMAEMALAHRFSFAK